MGRVLALFSFRILGVAIAMFWAGETFAQKRVALVVGNAKYQNINKLQNPLNDAPDFAAELTELGFDVIIRTDVDKGNFDKALAEFARKAQGADAALFYYAGHGIQYQKQNYLLPTDIAVEDYNDVEFQAVSVGRVMSALERSKGVKIVILDACRDNPLDRQLAVSSRSATSSTRGLARIDKTEGIVVAYATAPDQVAQDGFGRNSPFTDSLIKRLKEPGLEIATLFRRVTQDVFERTNGQQRPEVSISLLGDYYLNARQNDADAWAKILTSPSPSPDDLEDFIQRFPNSTHRFEAERIANRLKQLLAENESNKRARQEREALTAENDRMMREAAENKRRADDYEKRLNALLEKGEAEARAREEARNRDEEAKRQQLAQEAVDRRRLLAQQDDERKKLANEQQERDAARQRVAALLAAREQQARDEAARQLAEKQEAERQRIAEDLNKQQSEAERQKREAQLLLDQEAERKRLVEQLAAKKREDDLVAQRAEAERKKKEDDDQKRRIAEICVRETATLDGMTTSRQRANVEAMRGQTLCPTIGAKIDLALKTIDTALAQACATDRKTLSAAARTPDAIRAVREGMTCDAAKSEAAVQVARLEEDALKAQQACITDQAAFSAIDRTALDARDKLKALSGRLVCVSMNADINKLVVEIESRTKSAQTALRDLGCYSGQATGVFDVVTRRALVSYFGLRGAKFEDTQHVNDEVIEDLKAQPRNFCKPAEPQAPVAVGPSKASKPVAARPVEKIERVKRAAPAPAPAPVKAARAPREPRQMIPTPIATARPAPAAVSRPTISGVGF